MGMDIVEKFRLEDLCDRIVALEEEVAQLRKFIPTFDTASTEAVRYRIAFHQSQQKKRKSLPS